MFSFAVCHKEAVDEVAWFQGQKGSWFAALAKSGCNARYRKNCSWIFFQSFVWILLYGVGWQLRRSGWLWVKAQKIHVKFYAWTVKTASLSLLSWGKKTLLCFTVHVVIKVEMDVANSFKRAYLIGIEIRKFLLQIQPQFCLSASISFLRVL